MTETRPDFGIIIGGVWIMLFLVLTFGVFAEIVADALDRSSKAQGLK